MTEARFHPIIVEYVLDRITRWLFPHDIYPEPHDPPPECVQDAIEAQDSIGWGNLFRGFVALQWTDANATLHETRHDTPTITQMGAAMVRPCLHYFLKWWIECNAALHGGTKEQQAEKQQTIRECCIDEYHAAAQNLLPRDKKILFLYPPDAIKLLSLTRQKSWLLFTHSFIPQALRRVQTWHTGQTLMTQFVMETYNPNGLPREPQTSPGQSTIQTTTAANPDPISTARVTDIDSISIDNESQMDMADMLRAYCTEYDARLQSAIDDSDPTGPVGLNNAVV